MYDPKKLRISGINWKILLSNRDKQVDRCYEPIWRKVLARCFVYKTRLTNSVDGRLSGTNAIFSGNFTKWSNILTDAIKEQRMLTIDETKQIILDKPL